MKKNVLFVVDEKQMGGVSVLLQDILNNINVSKYNIDILVLHNVGDYLDNIPKEINFIYGTDFFRTVDLSIGDAIRTKSISIIYNKLRLIFLMKTGLIKNYIVRERKKMLEKQYDVEIAFKDGFSALVTAYGDSLKKYHWIHTDYDMFDCTIKYKKLFKKVFLMFDKIIAISNSVRDRFLNRYMVKDSEVIFNIIDSKKIIDKSNKEDVLYDGDKINLISVGRIQSLKGYDRLVDVLYKLDCDGKLDNVVTRIIGDGPDYDLVKNKIEEYGLNDKILMLGRKKNPYAYIKKSDCFLMCSRSEAFGLVVLESMILKVPVLSCEVASIKEIMEPRYGMIIENNEDGLYKGLLKIIEDKKVLKNYKKELESFEYDVDSILKQIEDLLDR